MLESKEKEEERPVVAKTAIDLQRLKLQKLMKNPEKPIILPERPKAKNTPTVPEFVRNVMGSSAGAGSGEFHVYRHLRRKEYARQKFIQEKGHKELLDEDYHRKIEENKRVAEEVTAKKRAKRLKKKQKWKQKKKMKTVNVGQDKKNEDSNSDTESSDKECDKNDDVVEDVSSNESRDNGIEDKPDEKSDEDLHGNCIIEHKSYLVADNNKGRKQNDNLEIVPEESSDETKQSNCTMNISDTENNKAEKICANTNQIVS